MIIKFLIAFIILSIASIILINKSKTMGTDESTALDDILLAIFAVSTLAVLGLTIAGIFVYLPNLPIPQ